MKTLNLHFLDKRAYRNRAAAGNSVPSSIWTTWRL